MLTHLHVHDCYSLLDGMGSPEDYVKKAKSLNQNALAISNHANMYSAIKFQKACKENNIKFILGCELYIVIDNLVKQKSETRGHLSCWVKDEEGYLNLMKILSNANLSGFYNRPRTDLNFILNNNAGLIFGTGCSSSVLNVSEDFIYKLHDKIGNDLYLEIMPHNTDDQIKHNIKLLNIHDKNKIKLIATQDCHYINKEDSVTHEVLLAMQSKKKWTDPNRWKFSGDTYYMTSEEEMVEQFKTQNTIPYDKVIEAINNTSEISNKCSFELKQKNINLPEVPKYKNKNEIDVLNVNCNDKLSQQFNVVPEEYKERLKQEIDLITRKNFIRYFLIVADIVEWAKNNNIIVGPGRGSVSGSLVAFLLGITEVDPIKYGTNFSRFLNDGRSITSPPDIDIDFDDINRHKVIERLRNVYGENNVAGITTFIKMEDKLVVGDITKVFDVNTKDVDQFCKKIESDIETAIIETEEGKQFNNKYPHIINYAKKLKGQPKALGKHAAGIIISNNDLTKSDTTYLIERDSQKVVPVAMDDCDFLGLLKLDVLVLSTLSIISYCLDLIKENYNKKIDLSKIEPNDKKIFNDLSCGNTCGVFQFSTHDMTSLSKEMKISSFSDMVAALALVRPGPKNSGMKAEYIKRKRKGIWNKKHEEYEKITKDTFGVVAYQEQVLEIFTKIAGLSEVVADKIRMVIGKKKDVAEFEPYKKQFIDGCLNVGMFNKQEANDFWEELQSYARYGFSKNHAVAYALISYRTAWLKHYYPIEFLCANLTYGATGQKHELINEAQRLNLKIVPPKFNVSNGRKWTSKYNKIYVPFIEVKGLGEENIKAIDSSKGYQTGFFFSTPNLPSNILDKIKGIGALSDDIPDDIDQHFDLGFSFVPEKKYKKLFSIIKSNNKYSQYDLINGNIQNEKICKELVQEDTCNELFSCNDCELRSPKRTPLYPLLGKFNVAIITEYPSIQEIKNNKLYSDDASNKVLIPEIGKHGFDFDYFHRTSFVKCYTKKEDTRNVQLCSDKWLTKELENVNIVLAFGNTSLSFFEGESKGITRYSGKTRWNEKYGCFVCYCVSPGLVLFKPEDFKKMFKYGINNFIKCLENIGGFK